MSATTRYAAMSRRAAMTAAALTAMVALAGCNSGGAGAAAEGDMAMGAPEGAKVTVVEYASVTCPHCAAWQDNTWEAFKTAYVDTNKVRYVFRELPTPPAPVAVAGFAVARCAGEDRYFQVVHELMSDQRAFVSDPRTTLMRVGNGVGLSEQEVQACITDEAALKAADDRAQAATKAGVTTTPAFFVNGTQVITPGGEGPSMEDLSKAIEAELAKG
ncbi:thioredoxin domain-containing protein [Brevundimonas sp.]|uniref:thioredoxin domain-containing protein n=1 Tax=Brevundimonas sp. TaxID=1871086 RepID=UPI002D6DA663|nr:thioredoxin domain-containing protein [Brevundimonas sp.]HYC67551.1 thioredoxin domain-containing protein [Brevundimonas sp.]